MLQSANFTLDREYHMNNKISLPPDAIARQEMLKKRQIESKQDSDSGHLLDQEKAKDPTHAAEPSGE